ncbi:MAG: DUF2784 domain-containing protein [Thermodesulfobacteriota bacterium]
MLFQLAGDIVVLVHFLFIAFVVLGGLLVLRWPKLAYLHIPAALWGALVEIQGWICPLTPLEYHFRQAAGHGPYQSGFIDHYIVPLIYPPGLTRKGQILLGLLVVAVNVAIYGFLLLRKQRKIVAASSAKKKDTDCH